MESLWSQLIASTLLDIKVIHWLLAAVTLFITVIIQRVFLNSFRHFAQRVARRTETILDDVLFTAAERPAGLLILVLGLMLTVHILRPPAEIFPLIDIADYAGRIASIVIGAWFLWRLIEGLSTYFMARAGQIDSSMDSQLVPFIAKTAKIFLVLTAVLVVAQNMGYSVSGLIASLGIGGIAIAMAARDTLANVFGSIMILLDRPFTVGDWIKTSEFEGVVEEIGFRSTRIRTFEKTLVNVPNSSLANMVIDNIDARSVRRIKMRIGITYSTSTSQMQQAIEGIEKILREHPGVDQNFKLVKFDEFADSSLSIFLYYFSSNKIWGEYLQVRQEINLKIMELLESLGLEFAFPTRTVHVEQKNHS